MLQIKRLNIKSLISVIKFLNYKLKIFHFKMNLNESGCIIVSRFGFLTKLRM